jgi:PAS domain S-box-containing protein
MQMELDIVALMLAIGTTLIFVYRRLIVPAYMKLTALFNAIPTIKDIHEQVFDNEETLRQTLGTIIKRLVTVEQRQHILMMDTRQALFETDAVGKIINVNRSFMRMLGRSEREYMGREWLKSICEYDADKVVTRWNYAVSNRIEFVMTFDMLTGSNDVIHVNAVANPITDQHGELIGYLGILDQTIK